jgi:hypothetical protein
MILKESVVKEAHRAAEHVRLDIWHAASQHS